MREGIKRKGHASVDAESRDAAEVDKQILGFDAPVLPQISLHAAADRVAGLRAGDRSRFRAGRKSLRELEIAVQRRECGAAGGVKQPIAAGKAEAAAQRRQPVDVGVRRNGESVTRTAGNDDRT